jgi:hypothetical protein
MLSLAFTHSNRIASHLLARRKVFVKPVSAASGVVDMLLALTLKSGLAAACASSSAVDVFPSPVAPNDCQPQPARVISVDPS